MEGFRFFLLITALCLLAAGKVTAQGAGAKRLVRTPIDSILFIAVFFFFTSLAFSPALFASALSLPVFLYAIGGAILNLAFQVSYTVALAKGPVGLTALFSSLAIIIPILGATFFIGESFGPTRIIGCALTLMALLLNTNFKKGDRTLSRTWVVAMILCFLSNGLASFWQKCFAKSAYGTEIAWYSFLAYFLAAIMALLLLLILGRKREWRPTLHPSRPLFGWCALVGLFLGCFQWLFTYSQRVLEASLLLPLHSGTSIVAMTLIGIFLFKEKPTARRLAATAVGVAAVVLFSVAM